jgi:hypothetical protein
VSDRRFIPLFWILIVVTVLNFGATIYFGLQKPVVPNTASTGAIASGDVTDKEAASLVREVVDLYNENKLKELYIKFDNLARVQITEESSNNEFSKLKTLMGKIEDYAYVNSENAGKEGDRPVVSLNYKVRLSGASFTTGTLKVTVIKKDSQLGLLGFFINAKSATNQ